jgi:hypothetical protein
LCPPTTRVKPSFLVGEQGDCLIEASSTDRLNPRHVLLTCESVSVASRKVISANGGNPTGIPETTFDTGSISDLRRGTAQPDRAEQ